MMICEGRPGLANCRPLGVGWSGGKRPTAVGRFTEEHAGKLRGIGAFTTGHWYTFRDLRQMPQGACALICRLLGEVPTAPLGSSQADAIASQGIVHDRHSHSIGWRNGYSCPPNRC